MEDLIRQSPQNMANDLALNRQGETVTVTGHLTRDQIRSIWPRVNEVVADARVLDIQNVVQVDSSGLAMLAAQLNARVTDGRLSLELRGSPPGFEALRAAYRLPENLHM